MTHPGLVNKQPLSNLFPRPDGEPIAQLMQTHTHEDNANISSNLHCDASIALIDPLLWAMSPREHPS